MKKFILILSLIYCVASNAQVHFGFKGGINYNSNSFSDVKDDVFSGAKSKAGFHAGIWLRAKVPAIGLYLRPELVYTQLSNDITYRNILGTVNKSTSYTFQKVDIPILLGKKFFKFAHVFGGPSFQYILSSDFSFSDLKEIKSDGFSLGVQFGVGLEFGKVGMDLRWERGLSDVETSFLDNTTGVNFDTRVDQIIVSISYRL